MNWFIAIVQASTLTQVSKPSEEIMENFCRPQCRMILNTLHRTTSLFHVIVNLHSYILYRCMISNVCAYICACMHVLIRVCVHACHDKCGGQGSAWSISPNLPPCLRQCHFVVLHCLLQCRWSFSFQRNLLPPSTSYMDVETLRI